MTSFDSYDLRNDPLLRLERLGRSHECEAWLFACACCRMIPQVAASESAGAALADAEDCALGRLRRAPFVERWFHYPPTRGVPGVDLILREVLYPPERRAAQMAVA